MYVQEKDNQKDELIGDNLYKDQYGNPFFRYREQLEIDPENPGDRFKYYYSDVLRMDILVNHKLDYCFPKLKDVVDPETFKKTKKLLPGYYFI